MNIPLFAASRCYTLTYVFFPSEPEMKPKRRVKTLDDPGKAPTSDLSAAESKESGTDGDVTKPKKKKSMRRRRREMTPGKFPTYPRA